MTDEELFEQTLKTFTKHDKIAHFCVLKNGSSVYATCNTEYDPVYNVRTFFNGNVSDVLFTTPNVKESVIYCYAYEEGYNTSHV